MNQALIPAVALVVLTVLGALVLRRFPKPVRLTFDAGCFLAFSAYFLVQAILPIFAPLSGSLSAHALWLRIIGGAWWWLGARLLVAGIGIAVHRNRRSREACLFSDLSAGVVYIATTTIVLNSVFAIPVTGVVATSGIVAIVLGLALQNTLADVFAGIAVGIEAPFQVGDQVRIGAKIEGQIVQVNWRSVRVQTDGQDIAVIPHSLVARSEIINRSSPSQQRAASVSIACPAAADPERVVEALRNAIQLCPDILTTAEPRAVLRHLARRFNRYEISFVVGATSHLGPVRDQLLRAARRQLYYAGYFDRTKGDSLQVRLLRDLVLLESLSDESIAGLASDAERRRLEPGEVLFAQATDDSSLYVIGAGILELVRDSGAAPEVIGRIGAGEHVGEMGLLTGAPHAVTATARTHCEIWRIRRESVTPLLSSNSALAVDFDLSLRRGLGILNREIAVRASPSRGPAGQLLSRIRSIFAASSARWKPA